MRCLEMTNHFPKPTLTKPFNFLFAINNNREGRCLHASQAGDRASPPTGQPQRKRAGRVDPHQPICLVATAGGSGERQQRLVTAEAFKRLADRITGHRGQPQPTNWFRGFCVLDDVTKNQFTFTPGITGIHHLADRLIMQ